MTDASPTPEYSDQEIDAPRLHADLLPILRPKQAHSLSSKRQGSNTSESLRVKSNGAFVAESMTADGPANRIEPLRKLCL